MIGGGKGRVQSPSLGQCLLVAVGFMVPDSDDPSLWAPLKPPAQQYNSLLPVFISGLPYCPPFGFSVLSSRV